MAELVGLVASIAGLIQLTGKVATTSYGYIGAVRNAPKDIQSLYNELETLKNVLISLENHTNSPNSQASALSGLDTPLKRCSLEMKELQSKLEPRTGLRKMFHRLKWPLNSGEASQAISQIERHKSLFNLALTADQFLLSKAIELFARNTDMAVGDLLKSVRAEFAAQKLQRQKDDAARAGEKRMKVLYWLYPNSFDQKHIEISTKRQKHTGKWLPRTPEFESWIKEDPDFQLLWGYGIPGAGKTFLSSLVIDQLENRGMVNEGVAYIYFNYKEQDHQTPINVVSCLIKQLVIQSPQSDLPKEIEALYDKLSPKQKRPTLEVLQKALLTTSKLFSRVFFVFDALDECDENSQRKELLPLFHLLCGSGARIFLTSRPHPRDIRESLSVRTATKIELAAREEDIKIYVEEKIKENSHARNLIQESFRDEIISTLVNYSNGMWAVQIKEPPRPRIEIFTKELYRFLLVHFYIEDLCQYTTLKQVQTALNELKTPLRKERPLDGIYNRAMDTVRRQHQSRAKLASKVLTWLVTAKRTLTIDEIRTAVSVEQDQCELCEADMPDIGMLLEVCAGLAIIDEGSNTIQLAHYSVQEYLVGNSVIPKSADLELAIVCTTFLSFSSFNQPCISEDALISRFESYPFLLYAAPQLSHHLKECNEDFPVDMLLKLLTDPGSLCFYVQARRPPPEYSFKSRPEPSPLHEASRLGHHTAVYKLLERGADVFCRDIRDRTALHIAAYGHEAVARLLLERGADTSAQDRWGDTPLQDAASGGHEEIVRLLLEKGADISAQGGNALIRAASRGHEEIVRLLLEKGADISAKGDDALTRAASGGHEEIVRLLLEKGADISAQGGNALIRAASRGHEEIVRLLLEKGADISAHGGNALIEAASRGHEEMVRLLLEKGADISAKGDDPLIRAASGGHEKIVRLLLEKGADISAQGGNTLIWAAYGGHEEMVRLLLEKGADISTQGGNALIEAASGGHEEIVRLLLEKGADILYKTARGCTALGTAAQRGNEAVARLLLKKGADILHKGEDGDAALHDAAYGGHVPIARLLLDNGADISAQNQNGWTPLHWAASRGNKEMVEFLFEKGANISARASDGKMALHLAAHEGSKEVVQVLLEKGADVRAVDNGGNTAVSEAESQAIIDLLHPPLLEQEN